MIEYIGKRFVARVPLHLPSGTVEPGEAFEFTAAMADYGLGPDLWLRSGQVEPADGRVAPVAAIVEPTPPEPEPEAGVVPDVGTDDALPADLERFVAGGSRASRRG